MLRGVCIWGAGCVAGEAWEMGVNGKENVGGYGGARVQRAVVVGARVGDGVSECLAERVATGGSSFWGQ